MRPPPMWPPACVRCPPRPASDRPAWCSSQLGTCSTSCVARGGWALARRESSSHASVIALLPVVESTSSWLASARILLSSVRTRPATLASVAFHSGWCGAEPIRKLATSTSEGGADFRREEMRFHESFSRCLVRPPKRFSFLVLGCSMSTSSCSPCAASSESFLAHKTSVSTYHPP